MSDIILINATSNEMPIADESAQLICFSSPYYGLRLYQGIKPRIWGGDPNCQHDWGEEQPPHHPGQVPDGKWQNNGDLAIGQNEPTGKFCRKCGAWYGHLGNEPTPELYVDHMVEICRECWRVLRIDGQMWLNLGFSYAGSGGAGGDYNEGGLREGQPRYKNVMEIDRSKRNSKRWGGGNIPPSGFLKPKDLIPIPWLVALALQQEGWWLRSSPPWIKGNCMPESCGDRPTTAHEYWFMFTKSERYYADADAVRMSGSPETPKRMQRGIGENHKHVNGAPGQTPHSMSKPRVNANSFARKVNEEPPPGQHNQHRAGREDVEYSGSRNRRTSDWFFESLDESIAQQCAYLRHLEAVRDRGGMLLDESGMPLAMVFNTMSYKGQHFATFSEKMVTPIIKFGTSEVGCCPKCHAPWERVTERESMVVVTSAKGAEKHAQGLRTSTSGTMIKPPTSKTIGWHPTCTCYGKPDLKPAMCKKCEGTGRELVYKTEAQRGKEGAQTGRGDGKVAGPGGQNYKVETGEVCPECEGSGVVVRKVWPDDVMTWPRVPCTVLDPFVGSGTTLLAARKHNRNAIGIDLSLTYLQECARTRLGLDALDGWEQGQGKAVEETRLDDLPMFQIAQGATP